MRSTLPPAPGGWDWLALSADLAPYEAAALGSFDGSMKSALGRGL
jgi:hypothetical protein